MLNFNINKFGYIFFSVLSIIYIALLIKIIGIHYYALSSINDTSIYDSILQYNWRYWFEESNSHQTIFASFVQFIDINYLNSKGILPIIVNIGFIFLLTSLIAIIILHIFSDKKKYPTSISGVLIFSIIIILFSSIQDSSIVWAFNQQLFAGYFFPLLSYYLLIKFTTSKNNKYFYALLFFAFIVVVATPYYFSALIVLLILGYVFKISWLKNLFISFLIPIAVLLNYNDLVSSFSTLHMFNWDMSANILIYILNYLGSLFSYVSFEPCVATSSIIAGIFILLTFIYFSYLMISKKATEQFYWIILAFLFFYILTAFGTLIESNNTNIILFKNQYMTPSLIAWSFILILYIHYFHTKAVILKRVLTLDITFITVLFFYQIYTYQQYKKDISELKLSSIAYKLGIDNKSCNNSITDSIFIMLYSPHIKSQEEMNIFTIPDIKKKATENKINLIKDKNPFYFKNEDAKKLFLRKKLTSIELNNSLKGSLEQATLTDKKNHIIKISGWVYDDKDKKVPKWLMILDVNGNIIGYITTGLERKDVESVYSSAAGGSGFTGYIKSHKIHNLLFIVDEFGKKYLKIDTDIMDSIVLDSN